MGNYKEQFGSFLKIEDIQGKGDVRVVVESVTVDEIKNDDGKDKKLVAHFVGKEKGLVLNRTNADSLAEISGSDKTEDWSGTPVILFVDPSVMFGGKKVGGIRMRGVRQRPQQQVELPTRQLREVEPAEPITEDDIPF